MKNNGFGQEQKLFKVTIAWKHGFSHSYIQPLNDQQLINEKERLNSYRWIESINFTPV